MLSYEVCNTSQYMLAFPCIFSMTHIFTSRTLNSATSTFITMLLKQTRTNFEQEFRELFDPEMVHDAGERQLTLKQGKLSAARFSLMFRTLGAERGVCQGLNDTPNQTGLLR